MRRRRPACDGVDVGSPAEARAGRLDAIDAAQLEGTLAPLRHVFLAELLAEAELAIEGLLLIR